MIRNVHELYKYHEDGTRPTSDTDVFVFGSNLRGAHGLGAAKAALELYGAQPGVGEGRMGQCYALPTKDVRLMSLSLKQIERYVGNLREYIEHSLPWEMFFITRVGCGYAGYTDAEIAPMFKGFARNCSFAHAWKPYLES